MSRPRSLAALSLLIGLGVSGLLGEGILRGFAVVSPEFGQRVRSWDPLGILIEPHGQLGFRQRPGAVFKYYNGTSAHTNGAGYRGVEVPVPKPAGVRRIILLGGSTTHGWGVNDDETIAVFLESALSERDSSKSYEVVNLAFDGYDSYQLYERLITDGRALEPDVVVVNSGINDVRNARYHDLVDRDPRTMIWEQDLKRLREQQRIGHPPLQYILKHYSYLLRMPSLVRGEIGRKKQFVKAVSLISPDADAADNFIRNMSRIDSVAALTSTPVLYSTPPSDLLTNRYPPDAVSSRSYWIGNAEVTQRYRDLLAMRLEAFVSAKKMAGRNVEYVRPEVPPTDFLDDAHLTPAGNEIVAKLFSEVIASMTDQTR